MTSIEINRAALRHRSAICEAYGTYRTYGTYFTSRKPNSVVLVLAGTKSRKQEVMGVSGFVGSLT